MSSFEVEQSFRNIVMFYQKELLHINRGKKASTYFSVPQRKKLTKIGVFEREYMRRGCRLKLTQKTIEVLSVSI
jgi:hypothetical protein